MRRAYKLLTIRGISLHIHWTFLLMFGWVLLVNAAAGNDITMCLNGDQEIGTVLEKLARNDEHIYPVMDNSHFVGVVNLNHIIEYLLLNKVNTKEYPRIKSLAGLLH